MDIINKLHDDTTIGQSIDICGQNNIQPYTYNLLIATEELSELQKVLTKTMRGKPDHDNAVEEVADVYITLEYICRYYGIDDTELNDAIDSKIARLHDNIMLYGNYF